MKYLITLLSFLAAFHIQAQTEFPQPRQIAENLFEVRLDGCNSAFLVTDSGVVVVDAGISPLDGYQLKASIASVTDKQVKYIILTHHHFDHIGGVQVFLPDAKVIAHEGFYKNMAGPGKDIFNEFLTELEAGYQAYRDANEHQVSALSAEGLQSKADSIQNNINYYRCYIDSCKAVRLFTPDIVFKKQFILHIGDQTVFLNHPGPAHTNSDCIVYFKELQTAHVGDLYYEKSFPYIDNDAGASAMNWIKILKRLANNESIQHYICGHGHIDQSTDFLTMKQVICDMLLAVKKAKKSGENNMEAAFSEVRARYPDYGAPDLLMKDLFFIAQRKK